MATKKVPMNDNESIVKYKVLCSEKYGRYLVAGKKIEAGEIIIRENPVVIGPKLCIDNDHACFECLEKIPIAIGNSDILCRNCRVAIFCCVACEARKFHHTFEECEILKNKTISFRVKNILLPLRLWLIKQKDKKLWKKILRLEAHLEARRDTDVWKMCEENVIKPLKSLGIVEKSEENNFSEFFQRICGILDGNSFTLASPKRPDNPILRGLYLEASLMAHNCRGNTFSTYDDKFQLTIHASKPIDDGEIIFFNYITGLLGMAERQKILREEKYFECDCPMCQDPYELGTNLSTMFCPYCDDGLITFASGKTKDPYGKEKNWKCNKCQISLSGHLIAFYFYLVKSRMKRAENSRKELEVILKKLSSTLHPNHFLMLCIKCGLYLFYKTGTDNSIPMEKKFNKVIEIATEMLDVREIVEPGISLDKGLTLCNMSMSIFHLANLDYSSHKITSEELIQQVERVEKYLKRSLTMLQYAPASSPDAIIAKQALQGYEIIQICKNVNSFF